MWENACFPRVLISTRLEEQADESYPSKFQFLTIKCATFVPPLYTSFMYNLDLSNSYIWRNTLPRVQWDFLVWLIWHSKCGGRKMDQGNAVSKLRSLHRHLKELKLPLTTHYSRCSIWRKIESHYLAKDDPSLKTAIRTIPCSVSFVFGGTNIRVWAGMWSHAK